MTWSLKCSHMRRLWLLCYPGLADHSPRFHERDSFPCGSQLHGQSLKKWSDSKLCKFLVELKLVNFCKTQLLNIILPETKRTFLIHYYSQFAERKCCDWFFVSISLRFGTANSIIKKKTLKSLRFRHGNLNFVEIASSVTHASLSRLSLSKIVFRLAFTDDNLAFPHHPIVKM